MNYVFGYDTPIRIKPSKNKKYVKLIAFLFVISLFFLQQGDTIQSVSAFTGIKTSSPALSEAKNYLTVKENSPIPPVYSKSYILLDAANGDVLIGKNTNISVPVASTTKMVTALVAREVFDLNELVTIEKFAANINGSEIKLILGEKITVRDLIKGLLIQSGNDAAFALAGHYGNKYATQSESLSNDSTGPGNYQHFVEKMNEYVKNIGLTDTVFGDPAGLDDKVGYSTAWDLANIARLILLDDVLAKIVTTPKTTVASVDGQYIHELESSNRLILSDSIYYLPGVLGIKTGFTPEAGHCLVSAYKFGATILIGVILNTNEYSITASASESKKLYNWANRYIENLSY